MGLLDEDFKFLLSIWSSVLPISVGAKLLLEAYYPNRSTCSLIWIRSREPYDNRGVEWSFHKPMLNFKFVPATVEISGVMGDSCAKEKPSLSSSEKGKTKVSGGNERPQKRKNKRTLTINYLAWQILVVNHPSRKTLKGSLWVPHHSDDSNMGDDTRIKDLSIADSDTFTKQRTLNEQDIPIEKIEVPLHKAPLVAAEHLDVVIFGIVEAIVKIKKLVDVDRVKALFAQDLTCSSEIAHIKSKLKFSLYSKKRQAEHLKGDLIEARFSQLQGLKKNKDYLKNFIDFVTSFDNV
ncbi:hypothetical protein Cgig2_033079 [Carnegiea gigantea]|uniref:Uncharacterized protein n=1 Tax=Carnegiea gigantea TaxID=171969 RepID=A0A9Q1GTR1_9CARY|nr:hypothetical protein Cgig2_033079 [Carnegiea gigantea]